MSPIRGYVFDAYGTLFDFLSASKRCRDALGEKADALGQLWRTRQLEYTWLRALMGSYVDFWAVTEAALRYSIRRLGLTATDAQVRRLMDAYLSLSCFPEVKAALGRLAGRPRAVLSNGAPSMLSAAVTASGLTTLLEHVISVDRAKTYKPSPRVYALGPEVLGVPAAELLFVSSNGWDVAGAKTFGYQTAWCNRSGAPEEELGVRADLVIDSLDKLPR